MDLARIWRLDIGEAIEEIEKYYDIHSSFKPFEIRGRILEDDEIIDNINVAENDVLLYEVKYLH